MLEAIQEEANPGINATIMDRYFNSACATPVPIFQCYLSWKTVTLKDKAVQGAKTIMKNAGELQEKFTPVMSKGMLIPDVYL